MALDVSVNQAAVAKEADGVAKKSRAEQIKEARAKAREADYQGSLKIRDELQKLNVFDRLTPETKQWLNEKCVPPSERKRSGGAVSVVNLVFGPGTISVGTTTTFQQFMERTWQGVNTLRGYIKKLEKRGYGIEAKFDESGKDKLLASVIRVTKLPA